MSENPATSGLTANDEPDGDSGDRGGEIAPIFSLSLMASMSIACPSRLTFSDFGTARTRLQALFHGMSTTKRSFFSLLHISIMI